MTRDTQESLRDDYNGFSDSYLVQENDAVYYDFDKNGSLDLFGFQYWSNNEGIAWYNDSYFAGTDNGNKWNPTQISTYLKYDNDISEKWNISNLFLYKKQKIII